MKKMIAGFLVLAIATVVLLAGCIDADDKNKNDKNNLGSYLPTELPEGLKIFRFGGISESEDGADIAIDPSFVRRMRIIYFYYDGHDVYNDNIWFSVTEYTTKEGAQRMFERYLESWGSDYTLLMRVNDRFLVKVWSHDDQMLEDPVLRDKAIWLFDHTKGGKAYQSDGRSLGSYMPTELPEGVKIIQIVTIRGDTSDVEPSFVRDMMVRYSWNNKTVDEIMLEVIEFTSQKDAMKMRRECEKRFKETTEEYKESSGDDWNYKQLTRVDDRFLIIVMSSDNSYDKAKWIFNHAI